MTKWATSLVAVGIFSVPVSGGLVDTVVDTTLGGATVDGTVGVDEYVGTVSGGGGGFGGPIGGATLHLDSDANGIYMGLANLGDYTNNAIRVFFDTKPGGFTSNAGFDDKEDFGRERLSEIAGPLNFPFAADYGLIISPAFGGFQALFELAEGGDGSLIFAGSGVIASTVGENPTASTFEIFIPYSNLGISAGDNVDFVVMYANHDSPAFVSDEGFPTQGFEGNPGSGEVTLSNFHRLTTVPEPAGLALLGLGALVGLRRRRS